MAEAHDPFWQPLPRVEAEHRPLWSVMIPTYNCAKYLRQTLSSVLAQDPGPEQMQIEVVDDCSSDRLEEVVRELGGQRVLFYRQPHNKGHVGNFRTCLERSRGRLVHMLHGDDAVRPGFYKALARGFEREDKVGAAFCRQIYIDEEGRQVWISDPEQAESGLLKGWLEKIAERQRIQTPSIAVRRKVYESIGAFHPRLTWLEDWEMWVRIAAHYDVWYEVEPLALYRVHSSSSTANQLMTGENLRDVRRAVEVMHGYLPEGLSHVRARALEFWADDALTNRVPPLLRSGHLRGALAQLKEALRCSRSPQVLKSCAHLAPVAMQALMNRLKRNRRASRVARGR